MAIELEKVKAAEAYFKQIGMRRYGFLPLELQVAFHQIARGNPAHQAKLIELGRNFERLNDPKRAIQYTTSALEVMRTHGRTNALMHLLEKTKMELNQTSSAKPKLRKLGLEWRTSKVRLPGIRGLVSKPQVRITHWAKHSPKKLLAALEAKPSASFPDAVPKFTVHPFGRYLLIARRFKRKGHYPGSNDYHPPPHIFSIDWLN